MLYEKKRKRNYGNIEIKGIVDVMHTFLLTDDSRDLCDIFNTSEYSDKGMTFISIMKKDMFPEWILQYKNRPKKYPIFDENYNKNNVRKHPNNHIFIA